MARILQAAGSWPGRDPAGHLDAHLGHYDEDVRRIIESQHSLMAYFGRCHRSHTWEPGDVRVAAPVSSATLTRVFPLRLRQRLSMTSVSWLATVDSDAGCGLRLQCVDTGTGTTTSAAAGTQRISGTLALARPDLISFFEVLLSFDGGGTYADLLSLCIYDGDLSAVP